jgi:peptidyl-prolyl cis-trans isomerase B (cyclophilin B)
MLKYTTPILCLLLLAGCEVRRRDGANLLGRSASQDTSTSTVLSIGRNPPDTTSTLSVTATVPATPPPVVPVNPALPVSNIYEIITPMGNMRLRLYDETPSHRDNFKKLVEDGFYNGTTFHRVIGNFMIQGGDPNSMDNDPYNDGTGGPGYTLNAEFNPLFFHKKGALAAARQGDTVNRQRRSSGSQFYIAQGRTYTQDELNEVERFVATTIPDPNFRFSTMARQAYTTSGGTPSLDMQYTVFGEIIDGFDVLDRISSVQTESNDRPKVDIPMTIRPVPTS